MVSEIPVSANTTGVTTDQVTNFMVKILLLAESYEDKITATNPYPLRPGMSATADIQTDRKTGVYSIPIQAVTTRMDTTGNATVKEDQQIGSVSSDGTVSNVTVPSEESSTSDEPMVVVFIVSDGKALMKEVKTGIQDNNDIEITEGLDHDAEVIVAPYSAISRQLKNNMSVEVVSEDELFNSEK